MLFDCSLEVDKIINENKLLYWFHFLQSQVNPDNSVILVGTKMDQLGKIQKDQKLLEKRLQEINEGKKKKKFYKKIKLTNYFFKK